MIAVHAPEVTEADVRAVTAAVAAGEISGSGGSSLAEFERRFAEYCGVAHGVAVSSGTAALHLAARLANLEPGDEVLVSACTNIATALAVVAVGGVVVPIDSEPDTWNLDPDLLERAHSARTRAVFPVHIYGHPADMSRVMDFAGERELFVVEDAAEAHGAALAGRRVGSFGDVACFSFYANKVLTTGEGGMLVTDRAELAVRARMLRNLCFGEPRFVHHEVGYNYRMTNMQAALGLSQLARIERVIERKRALAARYRELLDGVPGLRMVRDAPEARNVYWMVGAVVGRKFGRSRDELRAFLLARGVETRTMFCPLSLQPVLLWHGRMRWRPCPEAENLWHNGLYLPSAHTLSAEDVEHVAAAVREAAA